MLLQKDLILYVGDIINFKNNTSNHPLYIVTKNDSGYDVANELSGVVNQGASSGTLTLDLSDVSPGTYYYVLNLGNGDVRKSFVFISY